IEACGPPADIPDLAQRLIVGVETRTLSKGKSCEPGAQGLDTERLVCGVYIKLEVTPCPPCQRHEFARRASARQKFVVKTYDVLAFNLVAVALLSACVNQSFSISNAHCRARSAGNLEIGIGGGQL